MDEKQAIDMTRRLIENQFPRTCYSCGRTFRSLSDYLKDTQHLDTPIPYHTDQRKVDYQNPNGIASFATCKCGSTLAITSQGMDPFTFWRLMFWAIKECRVRKIFLNELLSQIRRQIDRDVIEEDKKGKANSPEVI